MSDAAKAASGVIGPAEEMSQLLTRVTRNPEVCGGVPCVRGTRMMVWVILDLLGAGMTAEEVVADYPYVAREDVRACLLYASTLPALRDAAAERSRATAEPTDRRIAA